MELPCRRNENKRPRSRLKTLGEKSTKIAKHRKIRSRPTKQTEQRPETALRHLITDYCLLRQQQAIDIRTLSTSTTIFRHTSFSIKPSSSPAPPLFPQHDSYYARCLLPFFDVACSERSGSSLVSPPNSDINIASIPSPPIPPVPFEHERAGGPDAACNAVKY